MKLSKIALVLAFLVAFMIPWLGARAHGAAGAEGVPANPYEEGAPSDVQSNEGQSGEVQPYEGYGVEEPAAEAPDGTDQLERGAGAPQDPQYDPQYEPQYELLDPTTDQPEQPEPAY
ncbi:MAG: hypothetical protein V2A77_01680 [Pseudomonadota bacterium]